VRRIAVHAKEAVMKQIVVAAAILTLAGSTAFAIVAGSPHDLRPITTNLTETCVSCHTPHQPSGRTTKPLWNHSLSGQASYGTYSSPTMNALPADIGGLATVSNLCMSCHDGSVSVLSLYNDPPAGTPVLAAGPPAGFLANGRLDPLNSANIGTDLTNDHPVNFTYDAALATSDGGLVTPNSASYVDAGHTIPLYTGTLQCASCHNPHDNANGAFLRKSNTGSALCITCHNK
jgi:predicted CXXCH cytochrome family protein